MLRCQNGILSPLRAILLISIAAVGITAAVLSSASVSDNNSSIQPPTASFTYSPTSPTATNAVQFTDTSIDTDGTVVSWLWSFGDGSESTWQNPLYQYMAPGTYTVTLTVTDDGGKTHSTYQTIVIATPEVNQPPSASFTYSPSMPTISDSVQFTDTSTDPDGTIARWSWSLGDGLASIEQNPTHQYSADETYTVTLTVTDNGGLTSSVSLEISVGSQPPTASFTYSPSSPTTGDAIQFTDTSTDPDGTIAGWSWSLGDGSASTLQNPVYQYTATGTYTVTLTVTDNDGKTDNSSQIVSVSGQAPNASFTYSPASPAVDQSVNFNGSASSDPDGSIVSYSWDFGDESTGSGVTISHTYSSTSSYPVTLTVTDDEGLTDSYSQTVTVSLGIRFAPPLRVEGTQILNNDGIAVVLRGVTTEEAWSHSESDIQYLKNEWNVDIIRLPLLPDSWWYTDAGSRESYLSNVDEFMDWTWNNEIYVVLDGWQLPGNPISVQSDLKSAWHVLANRYKSRSHIIWNIYNEPDDSITWNQWAPLAENLIDIILSYGPTSKVFTVNGVRWAQIFGVRTRPINRDNIIYAAHTYPDSYGGSDTWNSGTWYSNYGYIAGEGYGPVLVEEWGFPHWGEGNRTFGEALLNYCDDYSFGWIGWIWSDTWTPYMFYSGDPTNRTEFGQLVWEALTGVWTPS